MDKAFYLNIFYPFQAYLVTLANYKAGHKFLNPP
jgi:hypothetical protein